MVRAALQSLDRAWNADLDLDKLASTSARVSDLAMLQQRVSEVLPLGTMFPGQLCDAALERVGFAPKLFGCISGRGSDPQLQTRVKRCLGCFGSRFDDVRSTSTLPLITDLRPKTVPFRAKAGSCHPFRICRATCAARCAPIREPKSGFVVVVSFIACPCYLSAMALRPLPPVA